MTHPLPDLYADTEQSRPSSTGRETWLVRTGMTDDSVAAVCYAIFRECVMDRKSAYALDTFLWRAMTALERCPAALKPELEAELFGVAKRLGLSEG